MRYSDYVRDRILDAAEAEFLEQGFSGASLNRVLDEVGGSKSTIFRKFRSKERLFATVVERITGRMIAEFEARAVEANNVRDELTHFGKTLLQNMQNERTLRLVRMIIAEQARFPSVCSSFARIGIDPMLSRIEQRIIHWRDVGQIETENPRQDATHFLGLVSTGWLTHSLLGIGPERTQDNIESHVTSAVDIFVKARQPNPSCDTTNLELAES